jgi:hypothetical protein
VVLQQADDFVLLLRDTLHNARPATVNLMADMAERGWLAAYACSQMLQPLFTEQNNRMQAALNAAELEKTAGDWSGRLSALLGNPKALLQSCNCVEMTGII